MARPDSPTSPVLAALVVTLRPAPLLAVLANALVLALALKTAPFGIPLAVMLLSWTAKHSIATLHALAEGAREVPVLSLEMIFGTLGGWRRFLAMLVLVALLFATGAAAYWSGPWVTAAGALVAAAMLPPALLALGWTNSVSAAFDPRATRRFARALGRDFWMMVAASVTIIAVTVALFGTVPAHPAARIAVVNLGWLLLVAIAGTTVHTRREELQRVTQFYRGREIEPSAQDEAREQQKAADEVYSLWRNGARSDAWQRIEQHAAAAPLPEVALRRLYERALDWDAQPLASRIAQSLIELDMSAGRSGYALELVRGRLEADPVFTPRAPEQTLELARLAADCSEWSTAETLLIRLGRQAKDSTLRAACDALRHQLQTRRSSGP